jgi:hypothetical protein
MPDECYNVGMATHPHRGKATLLGLLAAALAAPLLIACDGPAIPIPPTPTPRAFEVGNANNHTHGLGAAGVGLFTRYGGEVSVKMGTQPEKPAAGVPATLHYTLAKNGEPLDPDSLLVTHEKRMHLIVVSRDLEYFSHLHPVGEAGGRYVVTETLPAPGPYLLYNEFFTLDGKAQIERDVLTVGESAAQDADPPLPSTVGVPQTQGGLTALLTADARKIRRRVSTSFIVKLTDTEGKPATDLEPFLGAPAHVVVVSADTKQFAHTHADLPGGAMSGDLGGGNMGQMVMPTPPARFGPELQFSHTFMQPGRYRVWVQFGHRGEVVTFGFNVEVLK